MKTFEEFKYENTYPITRIYIEEEPKNIDPIHDELDPYGEEQWDDGGSIDWDEIHIVHPEDEENFIGCQVLLLPTSEFYNDGDSNPKDTIGEIYEINYGEMDLHIYVRWRNGATNSYNPEDLTIVHFYDHKIGLLL